MSELVCEVCGWVVVLDKPLPDGRVYDGQEGGCPNCNTSGFVSCCSESQPRWVSDDEGAPSQNKEK